MIVILRLIHIVGGILWVGGATFTGVFLFPVLGKVGPASGPVMAGLRGRGLLAYFPIIAILTILSGLGLIWIMSGGFSPEYFATKSGAAFAGAGGLAILTFGLGMTTARPWGERIGALGAEIARTSDPATKERLAAELAAVQRKMGTVGKIITVMLLVAAAGMAVARYLT
jgi:hypothetical protein